MSENEQDVLELVHDNLPNYNKLV